MRHDDASRTTQRPALLRAAHQLLDDQPKIHIDPLAVGLIPEASEDAIRAQAALMRTRVYLLLRSGFVLRARYAEDRLEEAAAAGVSQYVILGAGFDTYAYRQPAYASGLQIFEVDHPASQAAKRNCLTTRGIRQPVNLTFVPVDFERDYLADKLGAAGFDAERPTCFSWLGVVQYLAAPAVDAVLRFVAGLATGTTVTFSFYPPNDSLDGDDLALALEVERLSAGKGEPWVSRYRPEELRALALRHGFSATCHLTPEAAEERYFYGRRDGLRAPRAMQLFTATV